jgi:transposase
MMHFYKEQHRFYCGVDLHTRSMFLCVQDHDGKKLLHQDYPADPQRFLQAIAPFRDDLVVGCECTFSWYWLADLCLHEGIRFVLGHALYMKAIHGGKNKSDKIDSDKITTLLRGGMFPVAYVYPAGMRETRDLLRRRMHLVHIRGEALAHIQNTNSQYNLPPFPKKLCYARNRADVAERFTLDSVRKNVELDLDLIEQYDRLITDLELYLVEHAKVDDPYAFHLLRSVPGIGKILSLVLLYEMHQVSRFPSVGDFLSYARLISGRGSSAGKPKGVMGRKIGNAHLKWAFSEAAVLMIRESDQAKCFVQRLEAKHGKPHALAVLRARIGRAVYYMLKRKEPFDLGRFFSGVRSHGVTSSDSRGVTTSAPNVTGSSSLCAGDVAAGDASGRCDA